MGIKVGTIYGIPLYFDYSWFIILALIVGTVGFGVMPATYPGLGDVQYLILGLLSAFLLFVSIIVHELAHSIIAKRNGLKIGRITLYVLGGVSEMNEEAPNPNLELKMAGAGPLTSLAIAGASFAGWLLALDLNLSIYVQGPLQYSALFNLLVAGFNLIPAFPMDGGRILRSLIWKSNKDMLRSTKTASTIGRIFAYALMVGGVFIGLFDFVDGIWLVLIGWFVSSGAKGEYSRALIMRDLSGIKARDMMARDVRIVSQDSSLRSIQSEFVQQKKGVVVIEENSSLVACVTLQDLRKVKSGLLDSLKVKNIMIPRDKLATVRESDLAKQVLSATDRNKLGIVFVLQDASDHVAGIITRSEISRTIQMQESALANEVRAPPGSERSISIQSGMLFEIDSPQGDWAPQFAPNQFALVSERKDLGKFTFQAIQKGRFSILLVKHDGKRSDELDYSILVS